MSEAVLLAEMSDRRGAFARPRRVRLYSDRLEVEEEGRLAARLSLTAVTELRLTVEPAGREAQVVARAFGPGGTKIAFGSLSAAGPGRWENNSAGFRSVAVALLEQLAAQETPTRCEEGPRLSTRLGLAGAGLALAIAGLGYLGWMAAVEESAILAIIGLPFIALGAMLAWIFRPAPAQPFDPADMAKRLSGGAPSEAPS